MIDPGSVVLADIPGVQQTKRRPAVVISTGLHQSTHGDIVLGMLTGKLIQGTGPTDYLLQDWSAAGLRKPTVFRVYLVTKHANEIIAVIGKLTDRDWQEVQERLRLALAIT